ncbi:MAG: efflux RND transporter periplasmic adaptor subunit [Candidatus Sedimenticola sp. 20ELBAFRAG]
MAVISRRWVILIPILIGVAAIAFLKKNKMEPVQEPITEKPRLVRVIPVPSLTISPKATGHGTVQPGRTWEAVAQVKGRIVEKHPKLEKGAFLEEGSLILRIDPTDYELAIAQAEADIQASQAQLDEQDAKAANTRASLKIEEASLVLNEKELQRKRKLVGKGGVSRSDLESQERSLLGQQQSVQSQKNTLNLIPTQKALLQAQLARHQASLATARRNLANTEIRMPFTGRIASANVEQEKYVREGEVLASADGMARAEVETQIPIDQMSSLFRSGNAQNILNLSELNTHNGLELGARVALQEGALNASWDARFARISDTLDPKTRTVGVIIEVDQPYSQVEPGRRPPLFKGLFVEVTLSGKPRPDSLLVPRSALHDGKVYVANSENRLEIRPVEIALTQPEFAVIGNGVKAGEQIVVTDLNPAIEGMLLDVREDKRSLERLTGIANGEQQ